MKGAQNENIPLQAGTTMSGCVLTTQSAGLTVFADGQRVILQSIKTLLLNYSHNYITFYDFKMRKKLHSSSLISDSDS